MSRLSNVSTLAACQGSPRHQSRRQRGPPDLELQHLPCSSVHGRLQPTVVGLHVVLELAQGLVAEIAPVDQEQHAPGTGVPDQAVDEGAGEVGLAGPGRHLDQRAGVAAGQGLLEPWQLAGTGDGLDLALPQIGRVERRHLAEAPAQISPKTRINIVISFLDIFFRLMASTCIIPRHTYEKIAASFKRPLAHTLLYQEKISRLGVGIFFLWRRGGDSNPRYPLRYSGLANRRTRPLCDLSVLVFLPILVETL